MSAPPEQFQCYTQCLRHRIAHLAQSLFTKNAANTKDSTNSPFGKFLAKTNYDHTDTT